MTLILVSVFGIQQLGAQDLEKIGKEKPVKVSGGASANALFYATSDSISRREPYTFYTAGNLNINIYDVNMPFTFSYSNQKTNFTQPFNQYCLHPKYKWVTAHIGYTSMSFSPYTLSGHLFLGAGADFTPKGPVKGSIMAGRLKKAVKQDTSNEHNLSEYERWGYGLKTDATYDKWEFAKVNLTFILFHAKDKISSLSGIPDTLVTPKENLVLGTVAQVRFVNNINLRAEYSTSGMTNDIRSEIGTGANKHITSKFGGLYKTNNTSEFYNAVKLNTDYGYEWFTVGVGYERIAPNYQTLGAYYFNNDLENITLNGSVTMLKDKVNIAGNVGMQHDNLNNTKVSEMERWVSSVNVSYSSGEKLNTSVSYSNFTSFTNVRSQFDYINAATPYENLDTLDFTQLSESATLNVGYIIKSNEESRQNININTSFQKASEKQGDTPEKAGSDFINLNLSYSNSYVPLGLTTVLAFNSSINNSPELQSFTLGPTLSANKTFFDKKLRTTLSSSYNTAYTNGTKGNGVFNVRANASSQIKKRHNINLSLVLMNRKTIIEDNERKITEFTATIGYSVGF